MFKYGGVVYPFGYAMPYIHFDKKYYKMTDLEMKGFLRNFIESIELYPERQDNGRILKQTDFKFPVYYDGNEGDEMRLPGKKTVEQVIVLERKGQ